MMRDRPKNALLETKFAELRVMCDAWFAISQAREAWLTNKIFVMRESTELELNL